MAAKEAVEERQASEKNSVKRYMNCLLIAWSCQADFHGWRDDGEAHINDPTGIDSLQDVVREKMKERMMHMLATLMSKPSISTCVAY